MAPTARRVNTHVYSWTLCIAFSNFAGRDIYFDYEVPSSRPPEYAPRPEFKDRFRISIESPVPWSQICFDEYSGAYAPLDFADHKVLTTLNQLLSGSAERFVGTYRSTVTGSIHRLRQERLGDRQFNLWPDERVTKVLSPNWKLTPDRSGFFDWNRYSLTGTHQQMAWMREWDYQLTSI
jgi:hypothetical protein